MSELLLTEADLTTEAPVPDGISIMRASASITLLITQQLASEKASLLVFNYDARTYNAWYPPFHFVAWSLPGPPATMRELGQALTTNRPSDAQFTAHFGVAVREAERNFPTLALRPDTHPFLEEVSVKYSKSQQQWTAYSLEYVLVDAAGSIPGDCDAVGRPTRWLPLRGPSFNATVAGGRYEGVPLVDNLLRLLARAEFVERLLRKQ